MSVIHGRESRSRPLFDNQRPCSPRDQKSECTLNLLGGPQGESKSNTHAQAKQDGQREERQARCTRAECREIVISSQIDSKGGLRFDQYSPTQRPQ